MSKGDRKKRLLAVAKNLHSGRVLVVGDVMLDQFIYGQVDRISPEAPVPVVKVDHDLYRLGGGANVAANLKAMGAKAVLAGVIGCDEGSERLLDQCKQHGIDSHGLVESSSRPTTIKTRIIAHHQQVVRFDRENAGSFSPGLNKKLLARLLELLPTVDAVIISDYGKGAVTKTLLDGIRNYAGKNNLVVNVDPKVGNFRHYKSLTLMTPNHNEAEQMLGKKIVKNDDAVLVAAKALKKRLNMDSLVITRGESGMTVLDAADDHLQIPTTARQVFDVTGAGDTVIAILTLAMACGTPLFEAAEVANFAAGVVVGKLGTATADVTELTGAIRRGYA